MREIIITQNEENQRLNKFLSKYLNKAPSSFIYKMLRKKNIKINNIKATGSEILIKGDVLQLYLSDDTIENFMEEKVVNLNATPLSIIFEDSNILIVNKPAGVLSHPNNKVDKDTIVDRIHYYLYKSGDFKTHIESSFTPAICNRLDRNTSGIVICGKNLSTVQYLNELIANNNIYKYYRTIVKGSLKEKGTLVGYHVKDNHINQVRVSKNKVLNSKKVHTEYTPIKYTNDFTLLSINLVTGKSHQIRSHLQSINYPILGDRKYGDKELNLWLKRKFNISNQLLHAEKIHFYKAEGILRYLQGKSFSCSAPDNFKKVENDIFKDKG